MKTEFILSYDRLSLFSKLHAHKSLRPTLIQEDTTLATLFRYVGEHTNNGFLALAEVFEGLAGHASFSRREELETHAHQIHPIPYIPIQRADGTIYTYQRGKGIGEERLALGDSIAPGGHVEAGDAYASAPAVAYLMKEMMALTEWRTYSDDIKAMIVATIRELHEEVSVKPVAVSGSYNVDELFRFELVGLLYDETNEVGTVHLGLVFRLHIPTDWTVTSREKQIEDRGFKLPEKVLIDQEDGLVKLESWSNILVKVFYDDRSKQTNNA